MMTLKKVKANFARRDLAMQSATALQDLIEPAPEALTVFEDGAQSWCLEAYFNDWDGTRDLGDELAGLIAEPLPEFVPEDVPERNWVAISQAALPPVTADRFVVHGSHDRHRVPRSPNSILIDAGEAFGTAHHATTLGCLLAIGRLTRAEDFRTILDIGTGSGVLAIAAAKALPHADIIATDLDAQSVRVASENIRLNGAAHRIAVCRAEGVRHTWLRHSKPFDLVIANILAGPLIRLAPDLSRTVRTGGTLVLSGLLIPQAPQVIATYRAAGFYLVRHDRLTGWSTLTLARG